MVTVRLADYGDLDDAHAIVELLDRYAQDPMGGGEALSLEVRKNLVPSLAELSNAFTVLAFVEGEPAGLATCFEGFSTFACRPIVNIHDLAVDPTFRGRGIATKMLEAVEQEATRRGAVKLTLEVLEGNVPARRAYEMFGFGAYELDPQMGQAVFWQKPLGGSQRTQTFSLGRVIQPQQSGRLSVFEYMLPFT